MGFKKISFLILIVFIQVSCKKNYACICETPLSTWETSITEKRQRPAKKSCEEIEEVYSKENENVSCFLQLVD